MPHPAIDERHVSSEKTTVHQTHTTGSVNNNYTSPCQRLYSYRGEPASTSNPIRSDGTRAPAPYFINRIYFAQRSSPVRTALLPGTWGWCVSPVSQVNVWSQLIGSNLPTAPATLLSKLHPSGFRESVKRRAQVEFLNKLADASGKDSWALGIAAGEFRQTAGMAADLASSLVNAARSIARGVKRPPRLVTDTLRVYGEEGPKAALRQLGGQNTALLETIVESWLVKQFGIDPLVNDLFNASVQLQATLVDPVKGAETFTTTIRGGASDKTTFDLITAKSFTDQLMGCDCYITVQREVKCSFSAVYRIPVKPSVFQKLGLYNPVHLGAQLTRFSWMADYVTNTSSWLRAIMAGQDCRFVEGSRSVLSRTTGDGGYSEASPGYQVIQDPMSDYVLSSDQFERTLIPITGVLPSFIPSLKNQLNATKMANSIAALTTLVGGRSRPGVPVIKY